MVVDDDPLFRMLIKRVAQQLGYLDHLVLCANLAEASQACARADFWVVDVNLPDGLGPSWVEQQRSKGLGQPTLLLSHSDWTGDLSGLQPCQFTPKPSALDKLRVLMQGWWNG